MTTIILTHYARFAHLGPEQLAHRIAEALNSIPRREAFKWLATHLEYGIAPYYVEGNRCTEGVTYYGHGFNVYYDSLDLQAGQRSQFIAYY